MTVLGCIADDFTGASDAASFLVKGGMSVRLVNGVPEREDGGEDDAQAIVVALKSRTQETEGAVRDSLAAAEYLLGKGARQIYFKYCSTFDSTPEGNIGPVADALMERLKAPCTVLCPALPVNGRTVREGELMVNGVPLHQSPMKNHPLTPMWDCRIGELMRPQSRYGCRILRREELKGWSPDTCGGEPFYLIPDYEREEDGAAIVDVFGDLPLLTGGSGLLEPLARRWTARLGTAGRIPESRTGGRAILLAGSCSKATLGQIAWYEGQGNPCLKLDPEAMLAGRQTVEEAWEFVERHRDQTPLVYSSDTPEKVREYQKLGRERVAQLLESSTAWLARTAAENGFARIICAGGETSGAVTKALGFSSYWIGESVAPGVPVMVPVENPRIRLILKSGNFGQEDFFGRALAMTEKRGED